MIENPILRGFNPDASVVKVGDDYYLATSTFEWWPGVEIYHSRDLVNWDMIAQPLNRMSQVNLVGNYNSGSIWAPHLSYTENKFWLVFTDMKTGTSFKDSLNYIVTCDTIDGQWSDPTFVTASGFDPSLFHDDDGKHYFMNMLFDHRLDRPSFSGVTIQEYDTATMSLVGKRQHFFEGTDLGVCEAPQILKKEGWYYLLCAAGGTGYSHASTVARSKTILGPYESSPYHPLITTKDQPSNPLQKSGHACFVEVTAAEWYIVHICARPLTERGNNVLGRETAIQAIEWRDGWPRLTNKTKYPELKVPKPSIAQQTIQSSDNSSYCQFEELSLPMYFKTLRRPNSKMSLSERPGTLRLYGEQSLSSVHHQSLIARRWQSYTFRAETELEFSPTSFQQMAGLVLFYDTDNWFYLYVSYDEETNQKFIHLQSACINQFAYHSERIAIKADIPIKLAVEVEREHAQFYYQTEADWLAIGEVLPADHLSDDYIRAHGKLAFTGAMVGVCCQDMDDHSAYADFSYFNYIESSNKKVISLRSSVS